MSIIVKPLEDNTPITDKGRINAGAICGLPSHFPLHPSGQTSGGTTSGGKELNLGAHSNDMLSDFLGSSGNLIKHAGLFTSISPVVLLWLSSSTYNLSLDNMSTTPFDIEKERQTAQMSGQSSTTNAPSATDFENENQMADHTKNSQEVPELPEKSTAEEADPDDEDEYPHGLPLFFIVVALGMSIFLVALDMVWLTIYQS